MISSKEVQILINLKLYIYSEYGEQSNWLGITRGIDFARDVQWRSLVGQIECHAITEHVSRSAANLYYIWSDIDGYSSFARSAPVITNRDIKLENVLFGGPDNNTVKLCDFGSCIFGIVSVRNQAEKADAEEAINKETTPAYRAPEMVDLYMRSELTFKTDIWALGCLLYCLCYYTHPFQEEGSLCYFEMASQFP